jgi:low affinity Fe/Cu permease
MTLGLAFWILMLIWAVFGLLTHFGYVGGVYAVGGSTVLLFVLFGLLGWQTFGAPLHK